MTAPRGSETGTTDVTPGTGATGMPAGRWAPAAAPGTPTATTPMPTTPTRTTPMPATPSDPGTAAGAGEWTTPEAATAPPDALPDPPADPRATTATAASPPSAPGPAASGDDLPPAVPRAGRAVSPGERGSGWPANTADASDPSTVLPGGGVPGTSSVRRPPPARPAPARPGPRGETRTPAAARPSAVRTRRARLALRRLDPWSVFVFSLIASLFVGVALVVAVAVLYSVLGSLGVTQSLNQLFAEVTGGSASGEPLLTGGRIIGGAAVLAALNVVFLTLLATLAALLYNLCASFTGGIEMTLGERD